MKRILCVALAVTIMLGGASVAYGDDGRIGGEPGNVHIVASDDIRMESETVQAYLYGRFAEYVVDFRFLNSGPEQTVRLGFPFGLDDKTPDTPPVALAGFLAYQGDTPLDVTLSEGTDGPVRVGWFEHTATFPPGETTIRVRYVTRPSVSVGMPETVAEPVPAQYQGMASYTAAYPYTLHTGAGWAGTIGLAVIRYVASPDLEGWALGAEGYEQWGTSPSGFLRPDDRTVQWVFEDFEPTADDPDTGRSDFDVNLMYYRPAYVWADYDQERPADPAWATPWVVSAQASSISPVEEYEYPKHAADAAADGDPATAWISAEGAPESAWVRLGLSGTRPAAELRVVPGYARTPSDYREHGRPKTIEVRYPGGAETFELEDEPVVQHFELPGATLAEATIVVTSVYPGARYDDVAIAELEIGSEATPPFLSFEDALALASPTEAPVPGEPSKPEDAPAADVPAWAWMLLGATVLFGGGAAAVLIVRRAAARQAPEPPDAAGPSDPVA